MKIPAERGSHHVTVRFSMDRFDQLMAIAKENKVTISIVVRHIVNKALEDDHE